MAREVSHYVCQSCGNETPKWSGQCPNCGAWNSLVETLATTKSSAGRLGRASRTGVGVKPLRLAEVAMGKLEGRRISSGIAELDRVLGGPSAHSTGSGQAGSGLGGMVPGSVMLLAGEPGIGKSTLLTQLALRVSSESID
ncbi:MAG: hypothetical protein HYS86_01660 [Candidatus Chisholmbacteria bacterium]|nr:hypothetical protein [Candidatus Chisholmbacteria bacterium]